MKTFVINLEKEKARMASMGAQLSRLGVAYERIPAVYGKELTKEELRRCFSAFHSFCAMGYQMTLGAIGCSLSHLSVYRQMIEMNIPYALVFEDDIIIDDLFDERITEIESFINKEKKQVILLSALGFKANEKGIFRRDCAMCADAYVITLPAARTIYKSNYPVVVVADAWRRWANRFGVEIYTCWPSIVRQDNEQFGTDINRFAGMTELALKWIRFKAVLLKPLRLVEKCIDLLIFKVCER